MPQPTPPSNTMACLARALKARFERLGGPQNVSGVRLAAVLGLAAVATAAAVYAPSDGQSTQARPTAAVTQAAATSAASADTVLAALERQAAANPGNQKLQDLRFAWRDAMVARQMEASVTGQRSLSEAEEAYVRTSLERLQAALPLANDGMMSAAARLLNRSDTTFSTGDKAIQEQVAFLTRSNEATDMVLATLERQAAANPDNQKLQDLRFAWRDAMVARHLEASLGGQRSLSDAEESYVRTSLERLQAALPLARELPASVLAQSGDGMVQTAARLLNRSDTTFSAGDEAVQEQVAFLLGSEESAQAQSDASKNVYRQRGG